ncbi:MAG: PaaI family thioesterase [Oscillochloridaceae bacterium umkhey_bin13]
MATFEPRDPDFAARVRASFARQTIMNTLGAELHNVAPGWVTISLPYRADLCQQHGFLHAGVLTTIVDSACGYAALSLLPPEVGILSIEFKVNFMAPARGEFLLAHGHVVRTGRTISVCNGEVITRSKGHEQTIALMQATMMTIEGRAGVRD